MEENAKLSDADGEILVRNARRAVTDLLTTGSETTNVNSSHDSKFEFNAGVFVTISMQGMLRGCIGYPLPIMSLSEGLVSAAKSAATKDDRFSPITAGDLDKITFEVTVLTPPAEITVNNPSEYLSHIKIGRDGLIVEMGHMSGLLLPQVALERGWDVEELLVHTCRKAGLADDAWKDESARISRFEGTVFREKSPNGKVTRDAAC